MANDFLSTEIRRISDCNPGDAFNRGPKDAGCGNQYSKSRTFSDHAGHNIRQTSASTLSQGNERDTPTPPIAVPQYDHVRQRSWHGPFGDGHPVMENDGSPEGEDRKQVPSQPSYENRSVTAALQPSSARREPPKLQVRTRTRGRSLLDEIAKDKFGENVNMSDSRKERSAAMQVTSVAATVPEEAIEEVSGLSESMKGSSPPVEEVFTPSERPLDYTESPLASSPASGSQTPGSMSGSWYGRKLADAGRSNSVRRTRRAGATPVSASPASMFLRQYSTSSPQVRTEDSEGVEIGEYVLGRELGTGGFSLVRDAFSSTSPSKTPTLAVKIVRKQLKDRSESENEELQGQFEHEIEVWRPLQHANILQMNEVIATKFATFVFMPLVKGGSLWDVVKKTKNQGVELKLAKLYAAQIAKALRYLHQDMRLVHRDVKLENCLIDDGPGHDLDGSTQNDSYFPTQPRVLLADFGLAEYMPNCDSPGYNHEDGQGEGSPASKTSAEEDSAPPGSLHYAAPELLLAKKKPPLNPNIDIWAYGVLLFALVTGNLPFRHSFSPKLLEEIKAGNFDRQILQSRIDSAVPEYTVVQSPSSPMRVKGKHECRGIFRNDSWARSCHTIVETEGFPLAGGSLMEVLDGCLNTDPDQRWDISQLLEAGWLASEINDEIDEGGLEMASR